MNESQAMNLVTVAIVAVFLAILIFGLAGSSDYEDALREHDHYCEMVNKGHWPNYKEIDCGKAR